MKARLDKFLIYSAYFYITLPFIIFLLGWIRWYYSIPFCIVILISLFFSFKEYRNSFVEINLKKHYKKLIAVACLILLWAGFSGIGGYSYQTWDHHFRNAIFRDLITYDWPVIYHVDGFETGHPLQGQTCIMAYYIGFWLPSALIGKLFGWQAGNLFLYLWTITGLILIFYFICRLFRSFSTTLLIVFIFWGTAYVIGLFVKYPVKTLIKSEAVLWAGNMFYADNNTGLLYWVFNQSITPWLIIILTLNQMPKKNIFFVYSLCFFQAPLAFIGFFPFVMYIALKNYFMKQDRFIPAIKQLLSFQNTAGSCIIFVISYLFFSSNSAAEHFTLVPRNIFFYLAFIFLSFGFIAFLIYRKYKNEPLFYISIFVLLPLPFFQLGFGLDFCARVSIPPMFILMLLAMRYLREEPGNAKKNLVIAYLIVSGIMPSLQIFRSITLTGFQYISKLNFDVSYLSRQHNPFVNKIRTKLSEAKDHNLLIKDDFKTLSSAANHSIRNFMGPVDKSFFYRNIAKTSN